jgi:predicted nucleic acid-binding Zn ribbon protein
MPVYVYAVVNADGSEGEAFEVMQAMSDPPLTVHPETGEPVRRLLTAPNSAGSG